jgi:hypothetical protein
MATPAVRHPVGDPPARWITTRKPCAEVLNGGKADGHTTYRPSAIGGRSCASTGFSPAGPGEALMLDSPPPQPATGGKSTAPNPAGQAGLTLV